MVSLRTQPTSSKENIELESLKEILAEVLKKRMRTSEMVASLNSTKLTGDIKIKGKYYSTGGVEWGSPSNILKPSCFVYNVYNVINAQLGWVI